MALSTSGILLVIATIIFPPLGVYAITGCGPDVLINVLLTILGYLPGHVHAFYLLYVFYDRRDRVAKGMEMPEEDEEQSACSPWAPTGDLGGRVRIFERGKKLSEA